MLDKDFGIRLRTARENKNITREEIATKLGITVQSYANFENGFRVPQVTRIPIIVKCLGITSDYLLGVSDV